MLVFTFSAAAYSRVLRRAEGFIPLPLYAAGCVTALVFFFWLRVLDEHKDREGDLAYRSELPVPRGLITLAELRCIGFTALAIALALNAWLAPPLLWACLAVAVYAALMTAEFFVPERLRSRPVAYLLSHMLIMPMIDAYTTGLDWIVAGSEAKGGLWAFLAVTFLNGCVLEIGRKIRAPEDERERVETYSLLWGPKVAAVVWIGVLVLTASFAWMAALQTGAGAGTALTLGVLLALTSVPAFRFTRTPSRRLGKAIDLSGGLWTLAMYLLLGAGPFLARGF